jgi:hypothetical protein
MKIEGARIASIKSAARPSDPEARYVQGLDNSFLLRLDPQRDLSLLTLEKALPSRFHAQPFASYQPTAGQRVTRVAYRKKRLEMDSGAVAAVRVMLLSLRDPRPTSEFSALLLDFPSGPGNSGGAVCDEGGAVIGIVFGAQVLGGTGIGETPDANRAIPVGTLALPVSGISSFLRGLDPALWSSLFPGRGIDEPVTPARDPDSSSSARLRPASGAASFAAGMGLNLSVWPVIGPEENPERAISLLRFQAKSNLSRLRNLLAEQDLQIWGECQAKETWRHEVAVYDNRQTFRQINRDGTRGNILDDLPYPKNGLRPGGEWYHLLSDVAYGPLQYLGSSRVKGKTLHVFGFEASDEDRVCYFSEKKGEAYWADYVDCTGQVIADEQFNTLMIGRQLYPPTERLTWQLQTNISFDFQDINNEGLPTLIPSRVEMSAQLANGEWHFASGIWKDYHRFEARTRILPGDEVGTWQDPNVDSPGKNRRNIQK